MPDILDNVSHTVAQDDAVVDAAQKLSLEDETSDHSSLTDPPRTPRPIVIYTRPQILALYNSPLIKPLDDMPPMKDWFGDWPEQSGKGYSETSPLSAAPRDRRFRREQDDNDPPPRATFRSTLSQPSQMGNFKHQSSRTTDRDRDRDLDKERERDIRDREGQERLRNLSDKYDRDRLGASASNGLRGKDRDSAPHLTVSSSRVPSSGSLGTTSGRRGEGRDGTRRKGETNDDWRRGRDDRAEDSRKDRGDRERPRSRNRDSSRTRRDPSTSRRDRDKDRDRDDRDREGGDGRRRGDRDRERDRDRDDNDDPRRWRDDGKRDERMAARRDRDRNRDGDRERPSRNGHDSPWDTERPRDRDRGDRWNTDERDGRSKRAGGRDRRGGDDEKDKDERRDRDRDREREREKEPAWMETYVPTTPGAGILGARTDDGLDSIQAWKKGMKEKEEKEKIVETGQVTETTRPKQAAKSSADVPAGASLATEGMDEIQLFKMMMKREQEKPAAEVSSAPAAAPSDSSVAGAPPGLPKANTSISVESLMSAAAPVPPPSLPSSETTSSLSSQPPATGAVDASGLASDPAQPTGSRFFPQPSLADSGSNAIKSPVPSQYTPPAGPRLLALGSRTSSATSRPPVPVEHTSTFGPTLSQLSDAHVQSPTNLFSTPDLSRLGPAEQLVQPRNAPGIAIRAQPSYPSFENQLRPPISLEDEVYAGEANRRQALLNERAQFGLHQDPGAFEMGGQHVLAHPGFRPSSQSPSIDDSLPERSQGGSPYQSKGSRFAKFFDGKATRDVPPQMGKIPGSLDFASPSPHMPQRPDFGGDLYAGGAGGDARTMEDIFAMLQNSAQNQRAGGMNIPPAQHSAGPPFAQNLPPLHMHQHERNIPPRNLDMLYDNRLDDRNFIPDGMVPGLRTAPLQRVRDNGALYRDQIVDDMAFNVQPRLPQQRGVEPMFGGPPPQAFVNQGRNIPVQQPCRNGVSPVPPQNALHGLAQQRVPPGLANLGGRPPHEPSQFVNSGMGLGGIQAGTGQPPFNNFPGGAASGLGYGGGGPQMRGPPPGPQLGGGGLGPNAMAALGHNKVDMRAVSQAQILGLGGAGGIMRVPSGGYPQQPGPPVQVQHAAAQQQLMRQQALQQQQLQQQQLQQQQLQQQQGRMLPPHMQGGGLNGQPVQDLMALLMHGAPRE